MKVTFAKNYNFIYLGLALIFISLIFLRQPNFFLMPRFWAEEATEYFIYAYSHTWLEALFAHAKFGYYSLFANVAAIAAANLVPLEHAPLITTLMAAIVQIIPLALIAFSRSILWNSTFKKILGMAIIMLTLPNGETWLNTINSQFHFGLIVFLLLLEKYTHPLAVISSYVLLTIAGLTGPIALFLIPLFIYKAIEDKTTQSRGQAVILVICAILQLLFLMTAAKDGQQLNILQRIVSSGWAIYPLGMTVKSFLVPLFGYKLADLVGLRLLLKAYLAHQYWVSLLLGLLYAIFLYVLYRVSNFEQRKWFLLAFLSITVLSMLFALGDKTGFLSAGASQRYFYCPNVILVLWLMQVAITKPVMTHHFGKKVAILLLTTALLAGVYGFKKTLIYEESWPKWQKEIAQWHTNPGHKIEVWPVGWTISLEKKSN